MKGWERVSSIDGGRLRRRGSVRATIDHFLDRLVDIFDFPVEPPAYSQSVSSATTTTRKYSTVTAEGFYTVKDEHSSPRTRTRRNTSGSFRSRVSVADRVRGLLHPRSSKLMKQQSTLGCSASKKSTNVSEPRELRMSWFLAATIVAPKEPQDELWIDRDEPDRQLECRYEYLADEATI